METFNNLSFMGRAIIATSLSLFSFFILFGIFFLAVGLLWAPLIFVGFALFVALQIAVLNIFIDSRKSAS